jgi:hypothetical protein
MELFEPMVVMVVVQEVWQLVEAGVVVESFILLPQLSLPLGAGL